MATLWPRLANDDPETHNESADQCDDDMVRVEKPCRGHGGGILPNVWAVCSNIRQKGCFSPLANGG